MKPAIAITGMACRYPDARSPLELWEDALAQRKAFRHMPTERLRSEDYFSPDPNAADRTYSMEAALIEGYEFDRVNFNVVGSTFRAADLAHWLALDVAAQALADAGFTEDKKVPGENAGVFVGNTLTGEFARAGNLRLRWPYVCRVLEAALVAEGWPPTRRQEFLDALEGEYKKPFPPVGEETLAGGLSNTIAGRICNHFDLRGGGYTVDGACASSLLAVTAACSALTSRDIDVALAGGVDLSLDPFELVGFAKVGALAVDEMRVYDRHSAGFWPGEGCGFVVLMRYEEAVALGHRIYAVIRGWGVSSDGRGGITRPEVDGQMLALRRAYRRAGFGIDSVAYFEGHGTGTTVGDATELRALSNTRGDAAADVPPAAIGSIKANIGHTKAAAGIAGLIKATMALHHQVLPPTTGCKDTHPEIAQKTPALRVLDKGELWPSDLSLRAGVSAMGFGGINSHVVLEGVAAERRKTLSANEQAMLRTAQDAELFLLSAKDIQGLSRQVKHLSAMAGNLSRAELTDLAAALEAQLEVGPLRAAIVASAPAELSQRLELLEALLLKEGHTHLHIREGVFFSRTTRALRVGFLFPGQGSPTHLTGGALRRRFAFVDELYTAADLDPNGNSLATDVAQPAIVGASLAALRTLDHLGIKADVAVGHSLGELTALHWAGALDEAALLRVAAARGKAMAEVASPRGAMASIFAGRKEVEAALNGDPVVIAGLNAPRQTVISGESRAVEAAVARMKSNGLDALILPVSVAFHSLHVMPSVPVLRKHIDGESFHPLRKTIFSTVTGAALRNEEDLRELLCRQITAPVLFTEAVKLASRHVDFWIEVGPGHTLSGLAAEFIDAPVLASDAGAPTIEGLLRVAGATFALGGLTRPDAIFAGRFTRPFSLDWHPRFFVNPCELAPITDGDGRRASAPLQESDSGEPAIKEPNDHGGRPLPADTPAIASQATTLEFVRYLVAERAELPASAIRNDSRMLSNLHLNSITVGQLMVEAARRLGLRPLSSPTDYADATIVEIAEALVELARTDASPAIEEGDQVSGIDSWVRAFTVEMVERPLQHRASSEGNGAWRFIAPSVYPIADALKDAASGLSGEGVIVCLPPGPDERHLPFLLDAVRKIFGEPNLTQFVLVQHGGGAASLARTLHLEKPDLVTCVIDVPLEVRAVDWIVAEIEAADGYVEAYYDGAGVRHEPVLKLLPGNDRVPSLPLGSEDVLLVTGGGKGITAECAIAIAQQTRASLVLMGLSDPADDEELATNLKRMNAAGLKFTYIAADVCDAAAVRYALSRASELFGPITGILHGAAINTPQLLSSLDEAVFVRTIAVKLQGLRNIMAAVDESRLRLLLTFGSIIARTGLPGEGHYALANEWLTRFAERFQQDHPSCRCLSIEWSVWSGVGMAQRLGGVDALTRAGITPITPNVGVSIMRSLLNRRLPSVPVVVTGRYGGLDTLKMEQAELPLMRFLEHPRAHYPGVELIAESDLSVNSDPYLSEHMLQGERILPAVVGLEAMAQVVMALTGSGEPPTFEEVRFLRSVVVPENGTARIRVAALVGESGEIDVALRSADTAYTTDHFRARCRIADPRSEVLQGSHALPGPEGGIQINPGSDLYNNILFHQGRFLRVQGYRMLSATECVAEIGPAAEGAWFGRYLPDGLVLGDAAARDAAIHCIQACIPHATVLPVGVDRLTTGGALPAASCFAWARERSRDGDLFVYDLDVTDDEGVVRERWEGLRLRAVNRSERKRPWPVGLLSPYVERRIQELIPGSGIAVALARNLDGERQVHSDLMIQQCLREPVSVQRRHDGKPEVAGMREVSVSHSGETTLAVASFGPVGCDIEKVASRPIWLWRDLLGIERFKLAEAIALQAGESIHAAATRVWAAIECLKKGGALVNAPLVISSSDDRCWALLSSGPLVIATASLMIEGAQDALVLAVLVKEQQCELLSTAM
ncbi:MAG: SDR family NAD(P)-dependent oxidoreductase [Blastocatellia bacterium]